MIKLGSMTKAGSPTKGDIYCYNKKIVNDKLQESYIFIRYDGDAVMTMKIDPIAYNTIDDECRISMKTFESDYTFTGFNAGDFVLEYEWLLKCCKSKIMYCIQQGDINE